MMDPDPAFSVPTQLISVKLGDQCLPNEWPVPPRTHRKQYVFDCEAISITDNIEGTNVVDPASDLCSCLASRVEVVITRTHDKTSSSCDALKIFAHDGRLSTVIHTGADVQCVAS